MGIDYIGAALDAHDPERYFEISIETDDAIPAECQIVIERPGQEKSYLSADGWQSSFMRNSATARDIRGAVYALRLSNMFLRYFEPGYNYKLSLFERDGQDIGYFVISWDPDPKLFAARLRPVAPEPEPAPVPDIEPAAPAFEMAEEPATAEPPAPSIFEFQYSEHVNTQRHIISCAKCHGEIFSTFNVCPYCSWPVTK